MLILTKIKICGLTRQEDVDIVNNYCPDYIGFVFAKSRRRVSFDHACYLKSSLNSNIKTAGVFVNQPILFIVELVRQGIVDVVQLHGDENEEYINNLKQRVNCPVIKAVRVNSTEQILKAQKLPCDMLLLDSYQSGKSGGTGKTFDHSLIPPLKKPYFLAGGLNSKNIRDVILKYRPFGVDISSGVETNGIKDKNKIKQVIQTVLELNYRKGMETDV